MKRNIPIYILLAFLLIMNGFFLVTHFNESPKKKKRKSPRDFIVQQLGFNEEQKAKFEVIEKAHHEKMRTFSADIRQLKDVLYDDISNATLNNSKVDSIASLIAEKEKEKDLEVFHHFRKIDEICTENQKERLQEIIKKALHRDKRGRHRSRGHRERK